MCQSSTCGVQNATTTGYVDVAKNSAAALREALNHGPVSVAIEADKSDFQLYRSGIYNSKLCGTNLNHGVTLIGYGTDAQTKVNYWVVRNSWGASWGESGYIRIDANSNERRGGICGILLESSGSFIITNQYLNKYWNN